MADIEKVLKGLEACICGTGKDCRTGCPYFIPKITMVRRCFERLTSDAHELLKEQQKQIERLEYDLAITDNNLRYYLNGNE